MSPWQLPHLMFRVLGGERGVWRWVVKDDKGGEHIWSLVQTDAAGEEHPVGIYAVGPNLPLAAKVFAGVTPVALCEMSERALMTQESLEQLERVSYLLKRMRARAYRLQRTDEYGDLRDVLAVVAVLNGLMAASQMPPLAELERLEYEALVTLRNPPRAV